MGFLGVYRALYDYQPQSEGELTISEGDLLYIIEKNDDDGWWKAKKKAGADDEDEPTGLVPHNYVETAPSLSQARAIYEYTRQTDEELSFHEDAVLDVFDTSDPDWILVGLDNEFGFVPANYINMESGDVSDHAASQVPPPALPTRPRSAARDLNAVEDTAPPAPQPAGPASTLAGVLQGRSTAAKPAAPPAHPTRELSSPSDEEFVKSPALPSRPRPIQSTHTRSNSDDYGMPDLNERSDVPQPQRTPGGFHMYNISEMVSVMGKRKKMPTTLGINLGTGILLIAPERAQDAPPQEWSADKMTHYSREGKHVFMELVRPSKSIDFHAGAKDTAEEIVLALGEMAGAVRAEGLKEVIMAGTQRYQRKGKVLYDFMAQGQDEVTVAAGDEVIILDDSKSDEWWQLRRLKNGKEGVVPSSYIEIIGAVTPPPNEAGTRSGMSPVEQNRLEEMRLTKEALRASKEPQQRNRRENGRGENGNSGSKSKSKPDTSKVRTWTDRSKSFSVEAQFLGLRDGKIHLHKMNGVKIAVPIAKMSREDLEYVENLTGISLEDDKPLADVRRSKSMNRPSEPSGAKIERKKKPEYDWFQFFLSCDVPVGLCERYAQAFIRDSMDESVLPDVNAVILRTLGIREGDIIKVMRTLDTKFGRERNVEGDGNAGGLFSGPGGALRNNTRKGRPAPAVQTNDVVDAAALSKNPEDGTAVKSDSSPVISEKRASSGGFEDDAWEVKPSKQSQTSGEPKAAEPALSPTPVVPALTGSLKDLSMLSAPLEPTKAEPVNRLESTTSAVSASTVSQTQPLPGASPSFFSSASGSQTGGPVSPKSLARQRPIPTIPTGQGSLPPPPTQRPVSAPQQQSAFATPALSAQMTGLVQGQVAPSGQSLNDITQARLQQQQYAAQMQQMQALQPTMTGYGGLQTQPPMAPFQTGAQYMQAMYTGIPTQSPFQDPGVPSQFSPLQAQHTAYPPQFQPQSSFGQATQANVNSYLPPALEPQRTGIAPIQQLPTSTFNSFNPQVPHALQPQKTGPPPPVRFGVTETKKLTAQPTGRRANLSQATPQNPFGF
ncbi:hypothetical protein ISF_09532 [Cordyceps fumosorosea ARSEF 2679]|uniref:Actin cytoskeleton-regulatory complex protein SLA1 n=1 Tax=Cordyceps fumosorosea (strain ARSEF 2679) TaxID=1081104 RepID=A0A167GVK3_CORFA|nr:hypothetical protein ISF_09532 [Cordyceps fumosorosea ARSEF 2679]OAA47159.1 hypothetical protein ISF_09532 [Cordyceps fumosorosea ARSEF 2679]